MLSLLVLVTAVWLIIFAILAFQDYKEKKIDFILTVIWFVLSFGVAYWISSLRFISSSLSYLFLTDNFYQLIVLRILSVTIFLLLTWGILKLRNKRNSSLSEYIGVGDIIFIYGMGIILNFKLFYAFMILASGIGISWQFLFKERKIPFVTILFITTIIGSVLIYY